MTEEGKTKKARAKTGVDTEARAALVALGKVMQELYSGMPSGVDEGYHDFLRRVKEFDRG